MAACSKCGAMISEGTSFCSSCGSPIASANNLAAPFSTETVNDGMASNVAGALSYLLGFITGIIFLVLEPYKRDEFVRFHAFQSICLNVVLIVLSIIWSIFTGMMFYVIGFLGGLFAFIHGLVGLGIFLFWIFLMYKAYSKEKFMIPIIGEFALKQAIKG